MHPPVKNLNLKYHPEGDVTQFFGENPGLYAQFNLKGHNGIDIVRPWGEPMYAIEDCTVISVKNDPWGYGKNVRLVSNERNDSGYYNEWVYAHNSENLVEIGDNVRAGQKIALMGNTGFTVSNSTGNGYWKVNPYAGTHLHLGLRHVRRPVRGGWSYKGSSIKIDVQDYDNGFKGAIDPTPYLREMIQEVPLANKKMWQQLLTIQSVINNIAILIKNRK